MSKARFKARAGGRVAQDLSAASAEAATLFGTALGLHQSGRLTEAEPLYRRIIDIQPRHFDALHLLGVIHHQRGEHIAAIRRIDAALRINPASAAAHNNRGVVLAELDRLREAIESYDRAIGLAPDYVDARFNRGNALKELSQFDAALAAYDGVLTLAPDHAVAFAKRGDVLSALGRFDEAVASYERAIALKPDYSAAFSNRGVALVKLGRFEDAIESFDRARELDPNIDRLEGLYLYAKMHICDWAYFEEDCARLRAGVADARSVSHPFHLLPWCGSPAVQHACARLCVGDKFPAPLWRGERYAHERIRVAYLSSDFCDHPVMVLAAGLFEHHDRTRFETTAVSFGIDKPNPMRERLRAPFDRFVDAHAMSDEEVAKLLRELEIDIAVDLNGFTDGSRPNVFAQRAVPVQVNYLGYAGTLGREDCDYIVADRFVVPEESQVHYTEKVVYLPDSFMANDSGRIISACAPSRAEAGLPEQGFVFCCFNNSYKITPEVFDIWMRLLKEIDGSVLWLSLTNLSAPKNLRREAERRGVAADRLVFASRVPSSEDHLARLRHADLFLDTTPYNAHATSCDALWAGVPVLTCPGASFASRVAGSLLNAVGLPELITGSLAEYEALALKLARDRAPLASLRQKLARNRNIHPLFDTARFTRHIEGAYTVMRERVQRGEPPQSFAVAPIARAQP